MSVIDTDQEKLIFLRLELNECQKVVAIIKSLNEKMQEKNDLQGWLKKEKDLVNRVFELEVLQGVEV